MLLLLFDLAMVTHSGLEGLYQLRPPVRVILLVTTAESSQVVEAMRSGARGILLKDSAPQFLFKAIEAVMAGEVWVEPEIGLDLAKYLRTEEPAADNARENKFGFLSERELEIVQYLVQGLTNHEIENHLGLSQHTVKHYLFRIFDKLGVSSRMELLLLAQGESSGAVTGTSGSTVRFNIGRAPKYAGMAGFAVKKPGSQDIDAWIGSNWKDPAAEEPLFQSGLLGGSTHVALAIAVRVARDRWTAADDKRYSVAFKKMIFEWADEIGKLPKALAGVKRALASRKRNRSVC